MKTLRTNQAKILGILGITACVIFGIIITIIPHDVLRMFGIAAGMTYFLWLGYEGLSASWIAIDGDDVLIQNGSEYTRIGLSDTIRVRTYPIFRYVGVITLCFKNGMKTRTLVSEQDLTWIMSRMPVTAITPYWRNKIGQQASSGQPATRSELDSEGSDKPQPDAEGRSR
jgi:hypothetical protein